MALDLGTVTSAVLLRDAFTGVMDKVMEGITQFEEAAKKAFPSAGQFAEDMAPLFNVATAAVLATTAAVTGLVGATVALAERGADVNDVADTLEHFSGSSGLAAENLDALTTGVQGTVDKMTLMKEASHLLSAGVKLTSDDFGTLGQAAFVLQNRGLGSTKEMLDIVSDAMVTGRTRALAMKLGVVDLGDAQKNYADSLGIEVNQLSDAGKAEAARVQIMKMLNSAVADAGQQELDFGEKVEKARATFTNWLDDLSVAVTNSPVLTAAIDELSKAFSEAFGEHSTSLIETVVHWIEQGLIHVTDFGLGVIEAARVADVAFNAIKTVVMAAATDIGFLISLLANAVVNVTSFAASLPFATEGMKVAAEAAKGFRDSVEETTAGFAESTVEAAKATIGQDAFSKKLDEAGGFLMHLKDTMVEASEKQQDFTKATDDHTDAVKRGTKANHDNAASMLDQAKLEEQRKKGLQDAKKLWDDYNTLVKSSSATSFDAQAAAIEAWKKDLIRQHKEAHTDTKEFYDAIEAVAGQKLSMIGSEWSKLADQSRESLRAQADAAKADYERMKDSGLHFTQDVLDAQLKKWMDLQDAANGYKQKGTEAFNANTDAAKKTTDQIKTLAGEMISLEEAAKRKAAGNTIEVTSQNFGQKLDEITNPWWNPTGQGSNVDKVEAFKLAAQGYSFQEILDIFNRRKTGGSGPIPPPHGPRIPGFAGGGIVQVGERGPELVELPTGSRVFPNGSSPTGGMTINMYINGSAREVAREIKEILTNDQRLRGRIPIGVAR